jgi:DNA-binding NtrC family response regulator
MPENVLIVDDDEHLRKFIARGLSRLGYHAVAAENGKSGIQLLKEQRFDIVLCDLQMPEVDGIDVLRFAATLTHPPPFIIFTAYGSVSVAVEAMKHGAADFLEKPVTIDELQATMKNVLQRKKKSASEGGGRAPKHEQDGGLVGAKRWLDPFLESLRRAAQNDFAVLILGETGTGKSAVARQVHERSSRASGPFVEVNCAAIPEHLVERELFGHVKGAFTDASTTQAGKVEAANGGTLFLDEIGELKPEIQAKLLQLLQERTFTPLGASQARRFDGRFITATNRDLQKEVDEKRFRADLYYRVNVVTLMVPPLRERPDDIPILIAHFSNRLNAEGIEPPQFSPRAIEVMSRYNWPGNVRELQHLVQHTAIMKQGKVVGPEDLDRIPISPIASEVDVPRSDVRPTVTPPAVAPEPTPGAETFNMEQEKREWEIRVIKKALESNGWNQSRAARMLGLKRTTLIEKMKKYGIQQSAPHDDTDDEDDDDGGDDGAPTI